MKGAKTMRLSLIRSAKKKYLSWKFPKFVKIFSERMTVFCANMGCDPNDKHAVSLYKEMIVKRMNAQVVGFHFAKDMPDDKKVVFAGAKRIININENFLECIDEYSIMHEMFYALVTTADNDKKRIRIGIYTINEEGEMNPEAIEARSANRGLNRGFTRMITEMMMNLPENDCGPFSGQAKIARQIRDLFGMDIVFKAMFEGPEVLMKAFEISGEKGKFDELSKIADEMMDVESAKVQDVGDKAERFGEKEHEQIKRLIDAGDYLSAINTADQYISGIDKPGYNAEKKELSYYFSSIEEFALYIEINSDEIDKKKSEIENVLFWDGCATEILQMKAYALFEMKKYEEAVNVLTHALSEFNPIGVLLRFELIENYFRLKQLELAEKELLSLRSLVMSKSEIARLYRRLGFCKIEQEKYEEARICLQYSLWFEKSEMAINEIAYIDNCLGNTWNDENSEEKMNFILSGLGMGMCAALAHDMKLEFIPTSQQMSCALSFFKLYDESGDSKMAEKFFDLLHLWTEIMETTENREAEGDDSEL